MKRRKLRCEKRTKNTPVPRIVPFAPGAGFLAVDQVCRAAERSGWPPRSAFKAAVILRMHGTSPAEAAALFDDCARRVQ